MAPERLLEPLIDERVPGRPERALVGGVAGVEREATEGVVDAAGDDEENKTVQWANRGFLVSFFSIVSSTCILPIARK